ncbi:putative nuclease HARBI1 [Aricia agestis]|uniref:putative nuclease HARBI1 n=1 Tax=Aricia agestis TaxID=91739 RepID=UPI001C20B839|nr:putative nuclease HARBI1 [Aricia agestis]
MSGKAYLAWNMLALASREDERREQGRFQASVRKCLGHPLENLSDNNFIKEYRLSKEAFEYLCGLLRAHTDLKSSQRVSLDTKVLCALLFYAHGSYQRITGKAHHFSQEAMSVFIHQVTQALNHPIILKKFIKFPTRREERDTIKQSFFNKYGFPGVIGCIDGSHFKIFTPNKEEEHLYFCRKHYHSLNVQMICDHNCNILSVNAKFGGATHDAFIWENSNINDYIQSLHRQNEIVWLLGDSGYPQRPWLMTPYLDPPPNSMKEVYNGAHISTRVVIENTFGRLKNRWRCLHRDRTLHYQPEKCAQIILACCVLHNIALKYNIPDPEDNIGVGTQEPFEQDELVFVNESTSNVLLRGRTIRDQVARRLFQRR